jgi:hypothetical protein
MTDVTTGDLSTGDLSTGELSTSELSTAADRDEQLDAGFRPLVCRQCGTEVRVRKHSVQQTSVQWQDEARCPYLARSNPSTAPVEGCPVLGGTIRDAVQAGVIPSGPQ